MSTLEIRSNLKYGWGAGANGWDTDMDNNLKLMGRIGFHLSVLSRTVTAPPDTPINGDTYIIGATATGAWAGKEGQVAVYDGSAWNYYPPRVGWVAYIETEEVLSAYKATGWSAGISI